MKEEAPSGAMDSRAARLSAVAFGAFGAGLVLVGVLSIATGFSSSETKASYMLSRSSFDEMRTLSWLTW